jgi:phosphate transport system substrate-binding protein
MTSRLALPVVAAALLAACTSDKTPPAAGSPAPAAARAVTVKGSDTMVILAGRLAENFMKEHPGQIVQVTGGGSGTGIAALINGTTDIADASRPMKDAEKQQVQNRRGAPAVETPVALDGLAIFVNERNPLRTIAMDDLARIYLGQVKNWKDVGGPDAPIVLYGRENSSGTYAYFKEHVLKDKDFAPETQTLPGTAAVVNAVARDPGAIGYGGIAYGKGIHALSVKKDAASPAVEPTMANVTSGTYPLSRYLFMYTAGQPTGPVQVFIEYARSAEGQKIVSDVGYYPLAATGAAGGAAGAPGTAPTTTGAADAGAR